jgi:hypothetical protein
MDKITTNNLLSVKHIHLVPVLTAVQNGGAGRPNLVALS